MKKVALRLIGFAAAVILLSLSLPACDNAITSEPSPSVPSPAPDRGDSSYVDGIGVPQALMPTIFHVPSDETVAYSTVPPTSGDHWSAPTQCGFYEDGVADELVVHNMEHGNVVMSFNLTGDADKERLREIHESLDGNDLWLVTRFYPDIPQGTVALTAWGVLDEFEGVDEDRIERFYEAYKGNLFSDETIWLGRGIPCTNAIRMDG